MVCAPDVDETLAEVVRGEDAVHLHEQRRYFLSLGKACHDKIGHHHYEARKEIDPHDSDLCGAVIIEHKRQAVCEWDGCEAVEHEEQNARGLVMRLFHEDRIAVRLEDEHGSSHEH